MQDKTKIGIAVALIEIAVATLSLPTFALAQSNVSPATNPPVMLESCAPDQARNPLTPIFGELSAFNCTIKNTSDASASVFILVTRQLASSNAGPERVRIPFLTLGKNEATTTQILLPAVFDNGSYTYAITLESAVGAVGAEEEGSPFGSALTFSAALDKPSVKIAAASLDKTSYASGDTAKLSLSVLEPKGATAAVPYYVEVTSMDGKGNACMNLLHAGPNVAEKETYTFFVTPSQSCTASSIRVRLLSAVGFPMDSKNFVVASFGGKEFLTLSPYEEYALAIVVIILIGLGGYWYYYKKRHLPVNAEETDMKI